MSKPGTGVEEAQRTAPLRPDEPIAEGWITTDQAAQLTGYEAVYIRRLLNQGRIPARKVGRDWLVQRDALLEHKARMDALGKSKHDPWRPDLAEQGRGRHKG